MTGFGNEEHYIDVLLRKLVPRVENAQEFALKNRVLLARTQSGIDVDIALGGLPFEERTIERASDWKTGEMSLHTCSAEDLIIHKVFAGRQRDWADVEQVLKRQVGKFRYPLIRQELLPLLELKGTLDSMQKLQQIAIDIGQRLS